ncbi:carbohydrate ABC transporter permease [Paenibacillus psychroresistens]|uniref:Carbohydrate ABC transporter permease n=1 Tax=Paenibacillus psychroresistens TaxID=1778678 RepID=A0A6B8RRG6_9BACL|nr:carbohydrate ABC transporter permease [Paenibacillus psychroresistens]QGQ98302.1 carbohydrate ABC transporter permease [Paenibacillus psychroresistens]
MKHSKDMQLFNIFAYLFVGLLAAAAVIPFYLLVVNSLQSEDSVMQFGYSILPTEFNLSAYKFIFERPEKVLHAYMVSIFVTVVGTVIALFFSSMTAYVLSRKDVKYRNPMAFYLFFTTLFSAGLVPYYLLVTNYMHINDTLLILLLSNMFNIVYLLIIRSYIANSIPDAVSESAKIDGANDFFIYLKIILPLMKPALAAIGLFQALNYWNDWYSASLFISKENLHPLQYMLLSILRNSTFAQKLLSQSGGVALTALPQETIKLALTVVATGPIVLLYPFIQRYFVAGLTIGSVKG